MGVFIQSLSRRPYAPPPGSDDPTAANANRSLLGGNDPNLIRVADGPAPAALDDDVQIAQQQQRRVPAQPQAPAPKPPPPIPKLSPAEAMAQPGRGYGVVPQEEIERGMSTTQKIINRSQALRDYARQQPAPGTVVLPDDWETTKPKDLVDDIKRAAQRHGAPLQMFARQLYQEGKFNEPDQIDPKRPIVFFSSDPDQPLGLAQMTTRTLNELIRVAHYRKDFARERELQGYSLANRAQAFDAAAEHLAYARRMTGSWHAALAAYNVNEQYLYRWLKGEDPADGVPPAERVIRTGKWAEMAKYLATIVRGAPEELQTAGMYEPENIWTGFKVAPPISGPARPAAPTIRPRR